jgi:hypothetical protein
VEDATVVDTIREPFAGSVEFTTVTPASVPAAEAAALRRLAGFLGAMALGSSA